MPIGTFTKNIHCHPRESVIKPPRVGPTTLEMAPPIPNKPIYFPRCLGGTISAIIFFGTVTIIPAPNPCNALNSMSSVIFCENPQRTEPVIKTINAAGQYSFAPIKIRQFTRKHGRNYYSCKINCKRPNIVL